MERDRTMRRTHLMASLLCMIALGALAADASAMYHPTMGRFLQRDPGPGHANRIGAGGAARLGGFLPRDPTGSNQYADGMNLYQYVRSSPTRHTDPTGLAVPTTGEQMIAQWSRVHKDVQGGGDVSFVASLDEIDFYIDWAQGPRNPNGPPQFPAIKKVLEARRKVIAKLQQGRIFSKENTELGGLMVGNFDVRSDEKKCKIYVEIRVKYNFEDGINAQAQKNFKNKLKKAVEATWSTGRCQPKATSDKACPCPMGFMIEVEVKENNNDYHKVVDVEAAYTRSNVVSDVNTYLKVGSNVLAHEFGHVLGLYDEYSGPVGSKPWWEHTFTHWHVSGYEKDIGSIMNSANWGRPRPRHFKHMCDWLSEEYAEQDCGRCAYESK